MPVLTINGRQVTVDDSFLSLPREEQDATVDEIASSLPKQEASGPAAGAGHAVSELIQGPLETAKQVAGIGPGRGPGDPSYVPANVRNGSWNPLNWNITQAPQAIAEMAPGLAQDAVAAKVGSKLGGVLGTKGKLLGALIGAGLSGFTRTAGDTIDERAAANNHDVPTTGDKLAGGGTALASAIASGLLPARLAPGLLKSSVGKVGTEGVIDAAKRYGTTIATGPLAGATGDVITQAGTTAGTEKGLTVDPGRVGDAAVNATLAAGAMAGPKFAGDAIKTGRLGKFGGENLDATQNWATRLEAAGDGKLGNGRVDQAAQERVTSDLQGELKASAAKVRDQTNLSQEAKNALHALTSGETVTPKEISLIEREVAGAPDGANTALLARTLHVAKMGEQRGQFGGKTGWTGGISGVADANVGYMLNPFRIATGVGLSLGGMHMLGVANPAWAGTALGLYGGARAIDNMTGMRSPAKTFVEHFADRNAQLRMPTTPQGPQAPTPGPASPAGPMGPWGPKPLAQQSVPQSAPPAPPAPQAPPAPNLSPIALSMLKQSMKQGLPTDAAQAPVAAAEAPAINPLNLPRDITTPTKNLMAGFRNAGKMANTYDTATRKAEGVAQAEAMAANSPTINEQGGLAALPSPEATKRGSEILRAAAVKAKLEGASPGEISAAREEQAQAKEQARAEKQAQTATERAQAKAERAQAVAANAAAKAEKAKAQAEAKAANAKVQAAAAQVKATQIKKANGKVTSTAPAEEPNSIRFEPYPEEHLYPKDISAQAYAAKEFADYGASSPRYKAKAEVSAQKRIDAAAGLTAQYPQYRHAISGLLRQLHFIGRNKAEADSAVDHYAGLIPDPAAAKAVREAFK